MKWIESEIWEDSGEMSGDPIAGEWVGPCLTVYYVNGDLEASYSVSVAHGPELNQPDQPLGYWVEDMTHTWRMEDGEPVDDEYEPGEGSVLFYGTAEAAAKAARDMVAHDRAYGLTYDQEPTR